MNGRTFLEAFMHADVLLYASFSRPATDEGFCCFSHSAVP